MKNEWFFSPRAEVSANEDGANVVLRIKDDGGAGQEVVLSVEQAVDMVMALNDVINSIEGRKAAFLRDMHARFAGIPDDGGDADVD